jgi:sugar lactone lactonase YvrE
MKIRTKRISRGLTAGLTTLALAAAPVFAQNPYRIATVAGAIYDRSGNNGPATQASITGLGAAFRGGYLYLTDSFRIWRIDPSGKITTVVGVLTPNPPFTPIAGYAGDGGPALSAGLRGASSIEFDSGGNLYISDGGDDCVRKVTARQIGGTPQPLNGAEIVTTFAGTCTQPGSILKSPAGLAFDPGSTGGRDAALYIASPGSANIWKADLVTDTVTPVAGAFTSPTGVAVDPASGALYVADSGKILRVDLSGTISLIAAPPTVSTPSRVRFGNGGTLYALDRGAGKVWQIANAGTAAQTISAVAGVTFTTGQEIEPDGAGGLFVADSGAAKVYFVAGSAETGTILGQSVYPGQTVTVAGPSSVPTFTGDGGPATQARLLSTQGVTVDPKGNLYISDAGNNRLRMVDAQTGTITTIAGTGSATFAGVPGPAASASITPGILQFTAAGGLFMASNNTHVLNDNYSGNLAVVNGTAAIPNAASIAFDVLGNLYVGDVTNGVIWKVDQSGNATKLATGVAPSKGIAVDPFGNVYLAKPSHQIQKVSPAGVVSLYAGTGAAGGAGDGGPALQATLQAPSGMVCDAIGNLYFTDGSNHTIRKIDTSGIITTIGGTPQVGGYSGDGGLATNATFQGGVMAFDSVGNLYLADVFNNAVRVLDNTLPTVTATATTADTRTYAPNNWTNQTVTVQFACSDTGSGVATCPANQAFGSNGVYQATGTATDRAGNSGTGTFAGIEVDKTAPTITPTATNANGTAYAAGAWTNQTATVHFTCSDNLSGVASCPPDQAVSAEGVVATVSGTATDNAGNRASASFGPVKLDTTAPVISGMPNASCSLWPANGKMVQVATVTAADALSGLAPGSFTVTGISNEPPSSSQIAIAPNGSGGYNVSLQADRLGSGTGRVYTLTATARDLAGNVATATSTCVVPHDQGK